MVAHEEFSSLPFHVWIYLLSCFVILQIKLECLISLCISLAGVVLSYDSFKDIHWASNFKSK
jgi:hypothetical protein